MFIVRNIHLVTSSLLRNVTSGNVPGEKCSWGEIYLGQYVHEAKYSQVKASTGEMVTWLKDHWAKFPAANFSVRGNVLGRNVLGRSVLGRNISGRNLLDEMSWDEGLEKKCPS